MVAHGGPAREGMPGRMRHLREPALKRQIELELEHQALQNRMLERQIELLENAQEYRCCPRDEAEDAEE